MAIYDLQMVQEENGDAGVLEGGLCENPRSLIKFLTGVMAEKLKKGVKWGG